MTGIYLIYAQDVFSLYDQRMNDAGVKVLPSDVKRGHQFSCTKVQVIPPCPDYLEGSLSGLTFMQLSEIHLSKSRIVDAVLQHQYKRQKQVADCYNCPKFCLL